jgi:hypothetical protein
MIWLTQRWNVEIRQACSSYTLGGIDDFRLLESWITHIILIIAIAKGPSPKRWLAVTIEGISRTPIQSLTFLAAWRHFWNSWNNKFHGFNYNFKYDLSAKLRVGGANLLEFGLKESEEPAKIKVEELDQRQKVKNNRRGKRRLK